MSELLFLVFVVIAFSVIFDFTNGFHDAANAIATSVATRALTPPVALAMAACMNFVGALLGTKVAETIGSGIVNITDAPALDGLVLVLGALIGAVVWNLITWWFGLPSSSSHALIGGLAGAGLVTAVTVHWAAIVDKVVLPMVISPIVGFTLAYVAMKLLLALLDWRAASYRRTMDGFRYAQTISAAAVALGHGLQDAQKTMGVMVLALVAGGFHDDVAVIPLWVKLLAAGAISAGTATGGFRIMRTLGSKLIDLDPPHGFVAETVAAGVLYTTAFLWAAPISTTQTITCAIMGVGATKSKAAVRWGTAGNIALAWIFTLPCAAAFGALATFLLRLVLI
ncbi:phosphate transporter [Actinobaculum suis]|uniref:Phosphate transporter n=1 Tax=Actinobaculum suis TaxID=1657 RepID=A0A7Z9C8S7_9ACTO|nr:inorganic phosphate transporter [Actinobaculum suis]VDG75498.1 phosphate transporter [Actinobaculum suis]